MIDFFSNEIYYYECARVENLLKNVGTEGRTRIQFFLGKWVAPYFFEIKRKICFIQKLLPVYKQVES